MGNMNGIHETAFVTCCYRAFDEALSGDPYAKHWITEEVRHWEAGFKGVTPSETLAHCLRNRYFLDATRQFLAQHPDGVLVNLGAGFSMYPYVLPPDCRYCDVDFANVVNLKVVRLNHWRAQGLVPPRDHHFMSANLDLAADRDRLAKDLEHWIGGAPTFFLVEGVIFFLQEASAVPLFRMFADLQKTGDRIGTVSFLPEVLETDVYQRLLRFLASDLDRNRTDYTNLPTAFFKYLHGYRLLEEVEQCALSRRYAPAQIVTDGKAVLNEHLYLLERR